MEFGEVSLSGGAYALLDSSKSQNDLAKLGERLTLPRFLWGKPVSCYTSPQIFNQVLTHNFTCVEFAHTSFLKSHFSQ